MKKLPKAATVIGGKLKLTDLKRLPQYFRIDRCGIWLDHAECHGLVSALKPYCGDVQHTTKHMEKNTRWKSLLELYQPTKEAFRVLLTILGASISAMPNYVELAWDIIADDPLERAAIAACRYGHMYFPYVREPIHLRLGTFYTGPLYDSDNKKRPRKIAGYHDDEKKLMARYPGKSTSHIEQRLQEKPTLEAVGILSIGDLELFDHRAFWKRTTRCYELPKPMKLGRLLYGDRADEVSDAAISKRARKFIEKYTLEGMFILHNALLENPELRLDRFEIPLVDVMKRKKRD